MSNDLINNSRVIIETEDWKLACFLDWRPKSKVIDCPCCRGKGEVGGGFKDIDGRRECPECFGAKIKTVRPTSNPPEIPEELRDHMCHAWLDFKIKNQVV